MNLLVTKIPPEAEGIVISSLRDARSAYIHYDGLITIEDVDMKDGLRVPDCGRTSQLVLRFDDLDFDDRKTEVVREEHMRAALTFARKFSSGKLLVHCHAGQCRSPGVALAVIAERMGVGRERDAVAALLQIRPTSAPNLLVLEMADRMLGRNGALKDAWMEHERESDLIGRVRFLKKVAWERPGLFGAGGGK